MTALDLKDLSIALDDLARRTWSDLADGHRLRIAMGETTITDQNLLALKRRYPALLIHKHAAAEEVRTGADWEWWIGTRSGWLCMVFQAKRLSPDGRYHGLMQRQPNGLFQADALLRTCWNRTNKLGGTVWPLYCLYNSWEGGWPKNIPMPAHDRALPRVSIDDLPIFGCAVVNAQTVRQVLMREEYARRRTKRDTYLPFCIPWSLLFEPEKTTPSDVLRVQRRLAALSSAIAPFGRLIEQVGIVRSVAPDIMTPGLVIPPPRTRRRQSLVWQDPNLISDPPDYVFDLLEQRLRPRRIKPLARRIAILVDPEART